MKKTIDSLKEIRGLMAKEGWNICWIDAIQDAVNNLQPREEYSFKPNLLNILNPKFSVKEECKHEYGEWFDDNGKPNSICLKCNQFNGKKPISDQQIEELRKEFHEIYNGEAMLTNDASQWWVEKIKQLTQ